MLRYCDRFFVCPFLNHGCHWKLIHWGSVNLETSYGLVSMVLECGLSPVLGLATVTHGMKSLDNENPETF